MSPVRDHVRDRMSDITTRHLDVEPGLADSRIWWPYDRVRGQVEDAVYSLAGDDMYDALGVT